MNIQQLIEYYRQHWIDAGKYKMPPTVRDCLDFVVTELGEAMDKAIRLENTGYTRNNEKETGTQDLAIELFDIIMMSIHGLDVLNIDLLEIALIKLKRMSHKRGLIIDDPEN